MFIVFKNEIDYGSEELLRDAYETITQLNAHLDDNSEIPLGFDEIVEKLSIKLKNNKSVRTNLSL